MPSIWKTPFICNCGFNTMNAADAVRHANQFVDKPASIRDNWEQALGRVLDFMKHDKEHEVSCGVLRIESYHIMNSHDGNLWGINVFDSSDTDSRSGDDPLIAHHSAVFPPLEIPQFVNDFKVKLSEAINAHIQNRSQQ